MIPSYSKENTHETPLLVTLTASGAIFASPPAKAITIAEARSLPLGTVDTVDGSGEVHIFVSASTGIDVSGLSPGQTIEVTGFSGQFADSFEVDPRFQSDIRVVP